MKQRNTNQNNMHVDCMSKPAVVILYGVSLTVAPVFGLVYCMLVWFGFFFFRFVRSSFLHLLLLKPMYVREQVMYEVRNAEAFWNKSALAFCALFGYIYIYVCFMENRDYFISNAMKYRKPNSHERTELSSMLARSSLPYRVTHFFEKKLRVRFTMALATNL